MSQPPALRRRAAAIVSMAAIVLSIGAVALAQRGRLFGEFGDASRVRNVPYDGRFTFVRIKYDTAPGGYWAGGLASWIHGYPLSEWNLMKIMTEVSYLRGRTEEVNVLSLDDPELFKYPVAYITEVGWWTLHDAEASSLRAYLEKGGFLIVDDFKPTGWRGMSGRWEPFAQNVARVLPGARFIDLQASHPIFHAFFEIDSLDDFPQAYNSGKPIFRGVFEHNDPKGRLLMIVNYNTDISQYWEWSGRGFRPFDETNEAYKLGVNYLIYAMTH